METTHLKATEGAYKASALSELARNPHLVASAQDLFFYKDETVTNAIVEDYYNKSTTVLLGVNDVEVLRKPRTKRSHSECTDAGCQRWQCSIPHADASEALQRRTRSSC